MAAAISTSARRFRRARTARPAAASPSTATAIGSGPHGSTNVCRRFIARRHAGRVLVKSMSTPSKSSPACDEIACQ